MFVTCGSKHILLHGGLDANNKELGDKFIVLFGKVLSQCMNITNDLLSTYIDDAWLLDVHSLTWIQIDAFSRMRWVSNDLI